MTAAVPPFFVVGCGRSGTTLLRVMLNRHSQLAVPLESLFVLDYLQASNDVPIDRMREMIVDEYELREWGLDVSSEQLVDCSRPVDLVSRLHELFAIEEGKESWGNKTPRFVRHWRLLKSAFPAARFVHVVRDPRAVADSLARSEVHRSTHYHGARRWVHDVTAGLEMEKQLGEDVLRLPYERLVSETDESIESVCRFLGVDPEPIGESAGGQEEYDAYYQRIHKLVSGPVDPGRAEAWRQEMPADRIRLVEGVAGDLMGTLGYAPSTPTTRPGRMDVISAQASRVMRLPGRTLHFFRTRRGYLVRLFARKRRLGTLNWHDVSELFI